MDCYRIEGGWIYLDVKAVPGASRNRWRGVKEGRLRVQVAAPPEEGKANGALCGFAAKTLGCAKKDAVLLSGERSRQKTLRLPLEILENLRYTITISNEKEKEI